MQHRNPTTERLTNNFERFNAYAAKALQELDITSDVTSPDVYATLALAYEMSQLRYQLSKHQLDDDTRARLTSAHER